jgi:hypothetical protein
MRTKVSGNWKKTYPRVKVSGSWRQIERGFVKVSGTWRTFKWPNWVKNLGVTLGIGDYQGNQRRRYLIDDNTQAVIVGAVSSASVTINGTSYKIRGIETGADSVGGIPAWQWLSFQLVGDVRNQPIADVGLFNGIPIEFQGASYSATVGAAGTSFMTYKLAYAWQPTTGAQLSLTL